MTGIVEPLYFGRSDRSSFGWYHGASVGAVRDCAVVLCAPLGHDTTGWHRALRHFAERLAAAGVAVLRFDYPATGDSAGSFEDPDLVDAWVHSVTQAVAVVERRSGARNIVVAGAGIGASFATAAALRHPGVAGLILWGAVANGRDFLRQGRAFARLMATTSDATQGDVEQIGGFVMSAETVVALDRFDPFAEGGRLDLPVLVVPRDESTTDDRLIAKLRSSGAEVERRVADGYTGVMADAHSALVPDDVIETALAWLTDRFNAIATLHPLELHRPSGSDTVRETLRIPVPSMAGATRITMETPIRFGEGNRLFGILARPADPPRRTAILLANSGAVYHVGPNGWYATNSRRWTALGYTVLRMDIGGLGDSAPPDGAVENDTYADHAVSDIAQGVAALRADGAERVLVGGLCSGAHAAFHAGLQLDEVDGLLMINPIVFYYDPSDSLDVASWTNFNEARRYKRVMFEPSAWLRLIRGNASPLHVVRIARRRLTDVVRAKYTAVARRFEDRRELPQNAAADFERMLARGKNLFLLFSAHDPGYDHLTLNYARELRKLRAHEAFDLQIVPDADHTFSALGASRRATEALTAHLLARHP